MLWIFCSITPLLVSRFLMSLRQVDRQPDPGAATSRFSDLQFNPGQHSTMIGNMGEMLEHGTMSAEEGVTDSDVSDSVETPEPETEVMHDMIRELHR